MTVLYSNNGLTVQVKKYGWPIGTEYWLTDGFHSFCFGSEMPLLEDNYLQQVWADYLQQKFDAHYCDEERETVHMVDDEF